MNPPLRFFLFLRLAVYSLLVLYVAGDFSFKGPLSRSLREIGSPKLPAERVVAEVGDRTITRGQLDRATAEHLWLQAKTIADLNPLDQKIARYSALSELIDQHLLDREASAGGQSPAAVSEEEVNARLRRLLGRFETKGHLETAMKAQGIPDENALRSRIAAHIRREKLIESRIAPLVAVTGEEARDWYAANQQALAIPERIRARHIFLPTLSIPAEQAKQTLDRTLAVLLAGEKDFATLARETSLDPATKDLGGELGWMSRARLPADFADPVFSLPLHQPTLFRTKIGWHLVEVTDRKAAESRSFEQAGDEIFAALETVKKQRAVSAFREKLRAAAADGIRVFHSLVAD